MLELQRVRDGVWAIGMPYGPRGDYSIAYLLRTSVGFAVIDPGAAEPGNLDRLHAALREIGAGLDAVTHVVGTHHHPDHIGQAAAVCAATGVPLVLHEAEEAEARSAAAARAEGAAQPGELAERWGVPAAEQERLLFPSLPLGFTAPEAIHPLADGEVLDPDGPVRAVVVPTPGHSAGHMCLVLEDEGLVLTGDHVMPNLFPGIGLSANPGPDPVADYLASLDRLAPYADFDAAPGHGAPFPRLGDRMAETRAHVLRRAREVAEVVHEDDTLHTWEVASRLTWSRGWDALAGFHLRSALGQTAFYRAFVVRGGLVAETV